MRGGDFDMMGDPPNPVNPPPGCRFRTRCPHAETVCERVEPPLLPLPQTPAHQAACHMSVPGSGHTQAPQATAMRSGPS